MGTKTLILISLLSLIAYMCHKRDTKLIEEAPKFSVISANQVVRLKQRVDHRVNLQRYSNHKVSCETRHHPIGTKP